MKLVQVNFAFDATLPDPQALLDRYHTLTGWSDAAVGAGLSVAVVQAFTGTAMIRRGEVDYHFCEARSREPLLPSPIRSTVLALEPDIVHVNGLDFPIQTWALRRSLPDHVSVVVQDHAGAPGRASSVKSIIRRRAMQAADAYLFTSKEQASAWIDGGFIRTPDLVHDVPEASTLMTPIEREAARVRSGITGEPAVLWVGRLVPNKDPLCVLDAFERALRVIPGARLTMIFDADALLPAIRARISASPALAATVRLAGAVEHDELAAGYSAADLFVIGSHHEGSGYALIEACACGVVPVVTDIAPFRALTGSGAIGVLWPTGDADACASALVAAARANRERTRSAVREHFAAHLSWSAVGRRASVIYAQVLEARRRRNPSGPRAKLTTSPCRAEPPTSNASNSTERPSSMR